MNDGFDDETVVSDLLLLVLDSDAKPLIVPITKEKLHMEQVKNSFCLNVVSSVSRRSSSHSRPTPKEFSRGLPTKKNSWLFPGPFSREFTQLSHYSKVARYPGWRRLYYFLRKYSYGLIMSLNCYAVAKDFAS